MMKKFLFLGAIAAMLLGTTACSNDMEPEMTDGTVQFKVELPGAIESRAISDGLTANKLTVAVYDKDGNELTDLKVNKDIPHQTTVEFKLVKGQTYSFAFWAQAEDAPYSFSTATKTVTVDYGEGKVDCNNESRDAFYAYKTYTVTGPVNETIKLTRPFAQLNFGADDLAAAAKAGITPSQSQVVVSKVGTAFNLATGKTEGEQENVTFKLAAIPTDTDPKYVVGENEYGKLVVNNKDYGWMAMNYFLAPGDDDAIISATMTVKTNKADVVVPATNVPVKKNHRTNIVGSLFTEDANFNVIIDQNFDTPDYNVNANATYYDVTEDGGLETVMGQINAEQPENAVVRIADGVTVTWTTGASHGSTPLITAENTKTKEVVLEGGEGSIFKAIGEGIGDIRAANGTTTLCFKNLTIVDESISYVEKSWEHGYLELTGKLKLENCVIADKIMFSGETANNSTELDVEVVDCKFISNTNFENAWNPNSSMYVAWISGGTASFKNCEFTGLRGVKIHEDYGSDVDAVYFENCYFHDLTEKPGLAFGTINAPTIISIKNSRFINCQPGDQGLYKYETDTPVANFQFTDEDNTVENN